MNKKHKTITDAQRHAAAVDLTSYFLSSYSTEWRLVQVLAIRKLLGSKYDFYKSVITEMYGDNDDALIAQDITNGLYFDAIAHCIQYVEDLFALIKASEKPDYFIKHVVSYSAGQITAMIKSFKPDRKKLGAAFHFPSDLVLSIQDDIDRYEKGIDCLSTLVKELIDFYIKYEFFYIQYKHGLTLAMKPFGQKFTPGQVAEEKSGERKPFLAAFDNFNIKAGATKKRFSTDQGLMMPGFTENVQKIIPQLHDEDNYLRFIFTPDIELEINDLVEIARKVKFCITIFITNYHSKLVETTDIKNFQLPIDYKERRVVKINYASV